MKQSKKIGVISLGCDKNRVDTEKMLAILTREHTLTNDLEQAEIIVVNTCAFLESARKEAVEEILSASALKQVGQLQKLIVTGCLPQKFIDEIFEEFTEVDAFLGVSDYDKILGVIDQLYQKNERINAVGQVKGECGIQRVRTTPYYAYLKIADGCANHCTYCLIPKIRGKYRSVAFDDLIEEAKGLGRVEELILVAQDVTRYGVDLQPKRTLVELIKGLSSLDNVGSIRLLYCYPECVDDALIEELKTNDKLLKYIDIPLQHADNKILKRMNRRGTAESYLELIEKLKNNVEGIAIRSTFITGFPGEEDEHFNNLLTFIEKAKLFNAGFFAYSREQGTPAYNLDGQVLQKVKNHRLRKLYSAQKKIVKQNNKKLIGQTVKVLAEGFDEEQFVYYGRAYFNAPDIDGKIYFFSGDEVEYGKYYDVQIIKATGYDLYGERL